MIRPGSSLLLALIFLPRSQGASPIPAPVTALAFTPDASLLVAAHPRSLLLFPSNEPLPPKSIPIDLPKITCLAIHPDSSRLWIGGGIPGESGVIVELALPSGTEIRRWTRSSDLIQSVALHPDQQSLIHSTADQLQSLALDPDSASTPLTFNGHSGRVLGIAFAPDTSLLVSVAADRAVKVWSPRNASLLRSFGHHTEAPQVIAFQPGATPPTCATAGDDRTLRIWQPGIGRMVRIVRHHQGSILTLAYAHDGQSLYSAGAEGIVRRIDSTSDQVLHSWPASSDWLLSLATDPRSPRLATGDATGAISLWTPDGTPLWHWP